METKNILDYKEYKDFVLHSCVVDIPKTKIGNDSFQVEIGYHISFDGCTLSEIAAIASDKIVRLLATRREKGKEFVLNMQGKTFSAKELVKGTVRLPKEVKILRQIEKSGLTEEQLQEVVKRLQERLRK